MNGGTRHWSISTVDGVSVESDALVGLLVAAAVNGGPLPAEALVDFDPRSTPDTWLAASESESPGATIDRFAAASLSFRAGVSDRLASGDNARERTPYGSAHWTVNVAHVLWDSWLHERDVLLPLEQSVSSTVQLSGIGSHTVEVSCDAGAARSAEVPTGAAAVSGVAPTAIDALAGRGDAVAEALPGAPEELGVLAAMFNS